MISNGSISGQHIIEFRLADLGFEFSFAYSPASWRYPPWPHNAHGWIV